MTAGQIELTNAPAVAASRSDIIDLLRTFASHLIVWHHLAFYGPLSDVAYVIVPALIDWLTDFGRLAVQVFFVVGGFTMARGITRGRMWTWGTLGTHTVRRYKRLGLPYLATLAVAIGANAAARHVMDHDSISASPTLTQFVAHAFFLHDILNYEALTAGIWYLAIDFQLGLLVLLVLVICQPATRSESPSDDRTLRRAQWILWPLAVLSLFWLNRNDQFDQWAIYFFGSYFLGMVAEWTLSGRLSKSAFWICVLLVASAVAIEWRSRLVVALATGVALFLAQSVRVRFPGRAFASFWGKRSYSLFLIHFPVCLVVNAWLWPYVDGHPWAALGGMVLAYVLSLAAAILFYEYVEVRFVRSSSASATGEAAKAAQLATS